MLFASQETNEALLMSGREVLLLGLRGKVGDAAHLLTRIRDLGGRLRVAEAILLVGSLVLDLTTHLVPIGHP